MRHLKLISLLLVTLALGLVAGSAATAWASKISTRYLLFLEPGPAWDYGSRMRLQTGYAKHVAYFRRQFKKKKVMMIGSVKGQKLILALGPKDATRAEMKALGTEDPMVKKRVLKFSVRDWQLDFEGKEPEGYSEEDELSNIDLVDY